MTENKDRYRILVESSLDPLVLLDLTGQITDANVAMATASGLAAKTLIGSAYSSFFTEPEKVRDFVQQLFGNAPVVDIPLTLQHRHGTVTEVYLHGSTYHNAAGQVLGAVLIARDRAEAELKMAEQQRIASKELALQHAEQEKRAADLHIASYARGLIEASRDPLITISPEGKITDMNRAMVQITGRDRDRLLGSNFCQYFTDQQLARGVYEDAFANGYVADAPLTLRHKGGKLTDVLFNGSVYTNDAGAVVGVVIVARDVTEQKRIATELRIAKEAAEEAVKAKQQFLSNISHEIRTPMTAIIGFTKVVLKTDLTANQREYVSAIKISGDALIMFINDILDLAKVDAGKMTFKKLPFKLASSISAMMHLFERKIREKNLELVQEYDARIPEVLLGDPDRLHQVLMNLLSNAVKFTTRGRISVSVRLLLQDADQAIIEFAVTDTGIGIEASKLGRLFEDAQQATTGTTDTTRLYGGTGLGLAIVKNLIEPQGGSINVRSTFGEGSTFSFTLGFKKTLEKADPETDASVPLEVDLRDVRILVVDDIAINQLLMRTLLEDFGFQMEVADNGQIAIEKLRTTTYDLILMDLQMPIMNGFEATEYIRTTLQLRTPIIALTADVTTVDVEKCRAVGMNDYISKPIDDKLLYRKIIKYLKAPDDTQNLAEPLLATSSESPDSRQSQQLTYVNFDYLQRITKTDARMAQMITLYRQEVTQLVEEMKTALEHQNWVALRSAAHSLIPTFVMVGINPEFEDMAKAIQALVDDQLERQPAAAVSDQVMTFLRIMFSRIATVCARAAEELDEKLRLLALPLTPEQMLAGGRRHPAAKAQPLVN